MQLTEFYAVILSLSEGSYATLSAISSQDPSLRLRMTNDICSVDCSIEKAADSGNQRPFLSMVI